MPACAKCSKETVTVSDDGYCNTCEEAEDMGHSSQVPKFTPCPCGKGPMQKKCHMQCTECDIFWHPACVGLAGLSYYSASTITEYKCPRCFSLDKEIIENLGLTVESESDGGVDIRAAVRAEMNAMIPEVVEEVKAGVRIALSEDSVQQLVSGAKEAITKLYSDVTKTEQKRVIKEVVEQTSEAALTKGLGRISADLSEQKNRGRNCIVSNIPEGHGGDKATLTEVVASFGIVEANDVADCKRLGELKPGANRLVLVIFKREDVAADFHNYGRGRNIEGDVWVNPDLTRTEREARFQMRQDRRRKRGQTVQPPVRNADIEASEDSTRPRRHSTRNQGHAPALTLNQT